MDLIENMLGARAGVILELGELSIIFVLRELTV